MTDKKAGSETLVVQPIIDAFRERRPQYEGFSERVHDLLGQLLEAAGIKVHTVEHRTKTLESLAAKVGRPGKSYGALEEIADISGLRVICYYTEDVDSVAQMIEREFLVSKENSLDKLHDLAPDQFGYRSVHYVVTLASGRSELSEWRACASMKAEIQVRTVLQHAWAAISHALQYKSENEVPSVFRRRLSRLAGILELADEEFSGVRRDQRDARKAIASSVESQEAATLELNRDTLGVLVTTSESLQELAGHARSAGFIVDKDVDSVVVAMFGAETIEHLAAAGIHTISQVEQRLTASMDELRKYLAKFRRLKRGEWRIDKAFLLLLGAMYLNREFLRPSSLARDSWPDVFTKSLLAAAGVSGNGVE